jgi:hypothetical protein
MNSLNKQDPEKYPSNIGKPWTDEDIVKLLKNIQQKKSHDEIAKEHCRTIGGIKSRLRQIATDYYFENKLPIKDISKYTGLSSDEISDAISRRQWRMDNADKISENKKEAKEAKKKLRSQPQTVEEVEEVLDSSKNDYHDTLKELLVVAKDIQRMMRGFNADRISRR